MLSNPRRVPEPDSIAYFGTEILQRIGEIVPLDHGHEGRYRPTDLTQHLPEDADEVAQLIRPIAAAAIAHYKIDKGAEPYEARINIRAMASSKRGDKVEHWHRDELFPDENLYMVSSHEPTEFACGEGVPLINSLPDHIPVNAMTNRLLTTGYLHITQALPHVLTVWGNGHIHRRPEQNGEPRVSVAISVYSRELALAGIYKNRFRYARFWWEARKPAAVY